MLLPSFRGNTHLRNMSQEPSWVTLQGGCSLGCWQIWESRPHHAFQHPTPLQLQTSLKSWLPVSLGARRAQCWMFWRRTLQLFWPTSAFSCLREQLWWWRCRCLRSWTGWPSRPPPSPWQGVCISITQPCPSGSTITRKQCLRISLHSGQNQMTTKTSQIFSGFATMEVGRELLWSLPLPPALRNRIKHSFCRNTRTT